MMKLAAPFCLLALAGCTVGPDYRPPAPASLQVPEAYAGPTGPPTAPADLSRWW